jgi:hypothetical protein
LIFDGKGQAKEGKGHDAFAGVSYERLNNIRIQDVRFSDKKVSIIADVTAAYEPELGVKKFIRRLDFSAPDSFVVKDEVETDKPQIITAFLHSDNSIEQNSEELFIFEPSGTYLSAEIVSPKNLLTKVEKNILTAPGRPGSVDKGEREERGVRLSVSTKEKVNKLNLEMKLKISPK